MGYVSFVSGSVKDRLLHLYDIFCNLAFDKVGAGKMLTCLRMRLVLMRRLGG